jgi:ssDNA thymidine ADP-ribosyltransferase, DarT
MSNISSVMAHGILSYERAASLPHRSVAMQPVQEKRDKKQVPGGLMLHHYANLYFHARNPMLFKRLSEAATLCVLRVSTDVLRLPGTVLSDQNAASDYVRFYDPSQWEMLSFDDIYALDWRHPGDQIAYWRHRARKCAEVLVPRSIPSRFVLGAYVVDHAASERLVALGFQLPIALNPVLFFQQGA